MNEQTFLTRRSRLSGSWRISALAAALLVALIWPGPTNASQAETVPNPHGDPTLCSRCHEPAAADQGALRFGGNTSQLCRSCHDGRLAADEVHPVDVAPSAAMGQRIPASFPLENGLLGCLTCHDITWHCESGLPKALPNRSFLRGDPVSHPTAFCFQCHETENYRQFNAHDQLEGGEMKADTCAWCHIDTPDVKSRLAEGASYELRSESFGVCNNCHLVSKDHPTGDPHMYATPSPEMKWHMSVYEMQLRMRLPYRELLKYAKAAKRLPRSIPLDEKGRITCYSCHNPHEKGLLARLNRRSSVERKQAVKYRLWAHGSISCLACHNK